MRYDWQCKKCGKIVEVERRAADFRVPPEEEGHEWERVIYAAPVPFVHLRQSGMFADEYGNFAPRKM